MWPFRKRADMVPVEAVTNILAEARQLFEAGIKASELRSGLLHQSAMSQKTTAEYRQQMESRAAEQFRNLAGSDDYFNRLTERES